MTLADGSVRFVTDSVDTNLVLALVSRTGGELVNFSDLQ